MIVKIEDKKIKSIIIGKDEPSGGYVCVPENWGTKEIISNLILFKSNSKDKSYSIDDDNPDVFFDLKRINFE